MIKIAVCEDNELQLEIIRDLLKNYIDNNYIDASVSSFADGRELLADVEENGFYNIYFLDLIMPDVNGLEAAKALREKGDEGRIIFLTASSDYAIASYDVKAFYYMLKPADNEKISRILTEAISSLPAGDTTMLLHINTGDVKIKKSDLSYIETNSRVPTYHLSDGRILEGVMLRSSFKEAMEELLSDRSFYMCGASMVFNLREISEVDTEAVLMKNGIVAYPAKSALPALKKVWKGIT